MDRYIEYASSIDAGFREKIKGASEKEIAAFEQAVGFRLPDIYKEFLLKLGHTERPVLMIETGFSTSDISEMMEANLDTIDLFGGLPPGCVIFAVSDEQGTQDMFDAGLRFNSHTDDPGVYRMVCDKIKYRIADSFYKYLYQSIFSTAGGCFGNCSILRGINHTGLTKQVKEVCVSFNYETQWFSDSLNLFCIRKDNRAIISLERRRLDYFSLHIFFQDESDIAALVELFLKMGLEDCGVEHIDIDLNRRIPVSVTSRTHTR